MSQPAPNPAPFLDIETLGDGLLIDLFNEKLRQAAQVLAVGGGKVKVQLDVVLEANPGSFKVDVEYTANLKAAELSKKESYAQIYLVEGGFAAEPSQTLPIPFPSAKRG